MVILNASRGPSLVPRPEEKVPSFQGLHMHLIMVELTSKMDTKHYVVCMHSILVGEYSVRYKRS